MKGKIKKNIIYNSILSISSIIFPVVTFPYVSRILLPEGTGKVAFATSTISYFIMLCSLGIPTYGVRECSKVRDSKEKLSKIVQELLVINIVLLIVTYILFIFVVNYIGMFQSEKKLLYIMSGSIILNVFGVEWVYKALEQYDYIAVRTIVFKAIGLLLMFVLIHNEGDYLKYGAIVVFSSYGSYILNAINLRKYISFKPIRNRVYLQHMRPIFVFFASTVAISVYTNLDTIMLGYFSDNTEVGLYNAAIKIKAIMATVLSAPAMVFLPRMTRFIESEKFDEFRCQSSIIINIIMLVTIPASLFFIVVAPDTVFLLSGSNYEGAIPIMRIVMPSVIFITMTGILGNQMLNSLGAEKYILISVVIAAVLDFVLNIVLIPILGGRGAALSTLLAEFVVFLVQISSLNRLGFNPISFKYLVHILLGASIAVSFVILIKKMFVTESLFLNLTIYAIACIVVYSLFLVITRDQYFKTLIKEVIVIKLHK